MGLTSGSNLGLKGSFDSTSLYMGWLKIFLAPSLCGTSDRVRNGAVIGGLRDDGCTRSYWGRGNGRLWVIEGLPQL